MYCIAVNGSIPWHSYGVSLAIWDHTVLSATRHKWTHPAVTPVTHAGNRFTYHGGVEGWVDLVDLIAPRPGVEPATFWSRVRRPTTAAPRQLVLPAYLIRRLQSAQNAPARPPYNPYHEQCSPTNTIFPPSTPCTRRLSTTCTVDVVLVFLKPTDSSRPSVPHKCLIFGLWLTLCTNKGFYSLTYYN